MGICDPGPETLNANPPTAVDFPISPPSASTSVLSSTLGSRGQQSRIQRPACCGCLQWGLTRRSRLSAGQAHLQYPYYASPDLS
jgi:hypothetical protein